MTVCGGFAATLAGGCASAGEIRNVSTEAASAKIADGGKLIASAPVLQNAAEHSIGVSFAVSADASGWVEIGEKADLSDARKVFSGGHGLMTVDDKVALIRVTGLKSATRYYYRIGADRIAYRGGYNMKNLGAEVDGKIHSFTTLGAAASGSVCVINDTHDQKPALELTLAKLRELTPAAVVWNGDASNTSEKIEQAIGIFLRPHEKFPEYAADTPYLFLNGNHDYRGRFNRRLDELMMFREATERKGEYAELGRNFVQRVGDIALIGLDTGEDKLDTNPIFAGIFRMQAYRELQTRWLAEAIESEAVKSAKYKVAFCHIPLFDPRPEANPGDLAPADTAPGYKPDYAVWQRTCANLWSPYFKQAGVQLVVTGHQHRFRADEPTTDRPWLQLVGGGPALGVRTRWVKNEDGEGFHAVTVPQPEQFPTVIELKTENGRLRVLVHDVFNRRIVFDRCL